MLPQERERPLSGHYSARVVDFLDEAPAQIIGKLAAATEFDLELDQRRAWEEEVRILKRATANFTGTIYLEFDIPRLGSRIDAVLVTGPAVFPIEFKCGERQFRTADYNQAWDYALDLKNFHEASHGAPIFPVLVATAAAVGDNSWQPAHQAIAASVF